jgi:hypothetical protein
MLGVFRPYLEYSMSDHFFFVQPTPGGLYEFRRTLFRDDPENPAARVLLASSLEELLRLVSGSGDRTAMDTDARSCSRLHRGAW